MKHILITILTALMLACAANAQTYFNPGNGHAYVKLGKATLADAQQRAADLGGHLLVVNDAAEYWFADANLIKRGDGWSWTGVAECDGMWQVDCVWDYNAWGQLNNRWIPTSPINQVPSGAVIRAGKFQATYRSTKWVAKFGPCTADGYASPTTLANVIVEIE